MHPIAPTKILLLLLPIIVLATTTNANNMNLVNAARARRDGDDPVEITLWQRSDDGPNLICDDSDPELGVVCSNIPFGDCCQGDEGDLFDSANNNQADGWTSFGIYSGSDDDACRQIVTSTSSSDTPCLAGGSSGMTITGAALDGPKEEEGAEGKGDTADGTIGDKMEKKEVKKRRAVRANLYAYRDADGTIYHVPINSTLGEEYRTLTTKQERREFMAKNGVVQPRADRQKKKILLCAKGVA